MAGWTGLEPGARRFSNLVMARDSGLKRLSHRRLRRSGSFTAVHPNPRDSTRVVETSLTTSAVSRDTLPVQAAGAGSH
jgi:hypothetical protein